MKIIDDLLATLNYDATAIDIRQEPFQTAVLTRGCGLASTPHDPGPDHSKTLVKEAGLLLDKDVLALARMPLSPTPLSPVLFDYGASAISSTRVIDPETVLSCVSQGATFRQIKGVRLLTMER